jgi:hypothetical protein
MYIPKNEMQQWRGQWICPNCRMDAEREEERAPERKKEEEGAEAEMYEKPGRCERCGRETKILYRFNNRNLCWYCLEEEDTTDYSGAGPAGGAIRVQLRGERSRRRGIIHKLIRMLTGEKEEEKETVISTAEVVPIKKKGKEGVPAKTAVPSKVPEKKEGHALPIKQEKKEQKKENAPVVRKEAPEKKEKEKKGEEEKRPDWSQWKRD